MGGSQAPRLAELAAAFDSHLGFNGRTDGTRVKYAQALSGFVAWAGDRTVVELSAADITTYLAAWLAEFENQHGNPPTAATRKNKITALKSSLLRRWHERGLRNPSLANIIRLADTLNVPPSQLLERAEADPTWKTPPSLQDGLGPPSGDPQHPL